MTCTRDLIILSAIVLLLGFLILATVLLRRDTFLQSPTFLLKDLNSETIVYSVESNKTTKNRNTNIERLRVLIAQGEAKITPSPSVESAEPEPVQIQVSTSTDTIQKNELVLCGGDDSLELKAAWPAEVSVTIQKGNRIAEVKEVQTNTTQVLSDTSTTSEEVIVTKQLFTSRAFPVKNQIPHCVPGRVIGITASGGLLLNDSTYFSEYGSESQIGFARDGFPIYGFYEGVVDECGGYQHENGYRYTLTKEKNTILNCFYGTPSSFTL